MSNNADYSDLVERVDQLETLGKLLVSGMAAVVDQNIALMMAVSFLSARLQHEGMIDGAELADLAIEHMNASLEPSAARSEILRTLLSGAPPKLPEMPKFTVIRGGKDDAPPDAST